MTQGPEKHELDSNEHTFRDLTPEEAVTDAELHLLLDAGRIQLADPNIPVKTPEEYENENWDAGRLHTTEDGAV